MLIFGIRSFLLHRFQLAELNINPEDLPGCTIEWRQRYLHLFWIPFIGVGRFWSLRMPDGELYDPSDDLATHLDQLNIEKKRNRLMANLLLLVAVALFLFGLIREGLASLFT